ncbi:txe/YoeB family addiction module toxin [Fusobacterium necrophorum subsp. funduliforme 1_1_36S]|nr:txe/YoeB family addiction module toxin [Fusobacterium necrophorum subsp. funduliforme 1_1_36S]
MLLKMIMRYLNGRRIHSKTSKKGNKRQRKIKQYPALKNNVENLISLLKRDPFENPPPYEILIGELKGYFSRRINKQHRLVYEVVEEKKEVNIISMWTHYDF